jgi:hypothetical protein
MVKRHHRCNLCGRDVQSESDLRDHVETRHPKQDYHWWVVAEDPDADLPFWR